MKAKYLMLATALLILVLVGCPTETTSLFILTSDAISGGEILDSYKCETKVRGCKETTSPFPSNLIAS